MALPAVDPLCRTYFGVFFLRGGRGGFPGNIIQGGGDAGGKTTVRHRVFAGEFFT